jgi:hypothetical protein
MPQSFSGLVRSSGQMQALCRLITRSALRRHTVCESEINKTRNASHKIPAPSPLCLGATFLADVMKVCDQSIASGNTLLGSFILRYCKIC